MAKNIEYETPEQTRELLNSMYFDNFKFWQREQHRGVVNENQSIKELAIRDNKGLNHNPYTPNGRKLDENAKMEWLEEMENPVILESEIPNAQTPAIVEHNKSLEQTIENRVLGDKDANSYVSKDELKEMLETHFNHVQSLIEENQQGIQSNKENTSLKETLKQSASDFRETLNNKMQSKVEATKESVDAVKQAGKNKLKDGIIKVNESIKNFSHNLDKKFNLQQDKKENNLHWYESKKGKLDMNNQPDNLKLFDASKGNGGIVAFDEPLTEQQQQDYGLSSFDKEKNKVKTNSKTVKKENEMELE